MNRRSSTYYTAGKHKKTGVHVMLKDCAIEIITSWNAGNTAEAIAESLNLRYGFGTYRQVITAYISRMRSGRIKLPPGTKIRSGQKKRRGVTSFQEAAAGRHMPHRDPNMAQELQPWNADAMDSPVAYGQLSLHGCRWPGPSSAGDRRFCGYPSEHGAYCKLHASIAYTELPDAVRMEKFWCF